MLFATFEYIIFLTLTVLLYFSLQLRARQWLLLAASYLFYAVWSLPFAGLMLIVSSAHYYFALKIQNEANEAKRGRYLIAAIAFSLSILCYFKYIDFSLSSFHNMLLIFDISIDIPTINIVLPLGISFYTFQSMSYSIDVYRKDIEACTDFVTVTLYISFFPQLVAGPIERAAHIIPQLQKKHELNWDNIREGGNLILWGLFKKMILADNLAPISDAFFADPGRYDALSALLGVYAFAFQIYFDFSAYSQIARGSAKLFGIELVRNFDMPYLAHSASDFWRRWHISLSNWLRDYIYIPLGGSRQGTLKTLRNLMTTMLLGGLWHGANWTFVAWGGFHGVLLAVQSTAGKEINRLAGKSIGKALLILVNFHLVCLGWIFFRADSFTKALEALKGLLTLGGAARLPDFGVGCLLIAAAGVGHVFFALFRDKIIELRHKQALVCNVAYITAMLCALTVLAAPGQSFIYFEF